MASEVNVEPRQRLASPLQVGKMLNASVRSLQRAVREGRMPKPHKFGRLTRFDLDEINRWIDSDCPKVGDSSDAAGS